MLFNVIVTLLKQVCQGIVPYISELDKPSAVSLTCEKKSMTKNRLMLIVHVGCCTRPVTPQQYDHYPRSRGTVMWITDKERHVINNTVFLSKCHITPVDLFLDLSSVCWPVFFFIVSSHIWYWYSFLKRSLAHLCFIVACGNCFFCFLVHFLPLSLFQLG